MSKKVKYAKLHAGFFIPGVGEFKDTLPPDNKSLPGLQMLLTEHEGILLTWGNGFSALIGAANVKVALLEAVPVTEVKLA